MMKHLGLAAVLALVMAWGVSFPAQAEAHWKKGYHHRQWQDSAPGYRHSMGQGYCDGYGCQVQGRDWSRDDRRQSRDDRRDWHRGDRRPESFRDQPRQWCPYN